LLLCEHVFVPPRYSELEARAAAAVSFSYAETLRRLGMCSTGNAWKILKKYTELWCIRDLRRGRTYRHIERPAALAA
jgi:hypothetical protein